MPLVLDPEEHAFVANVSATKGKKDERFDNVGILVSLLSDH